MCLQLGIFLSGISGEGLGENPMGGITSHPVANDRMSPSFDGPSSAEKYNDNINC